MQFDRFVTSSESFDSFVNIFGADQKLAPALSGNLPLANVCRDGRWSGHLDIISARTHLSHRLQKLTAA